MKIVLATLLATGLIAASTGAQAANLILDGDFNNSNATFSTVTAVSTIGPWHVTAGSVDLIGGYWQSPSGPNASAAGTNGSIDLNGNAPGTLSQSFATQIGKTYEVTFDLSANPDGGPAVKSTKVKVGPASGVFSFPSVAASHANMNYIPETINFTATSNTTTLTFLGNNTSQYGAVIGDVSVLAVPEPATWASLLLGLGAMGAVMRTRRRAVAAI